MIKTTFKKVVFKSKRIRMLLLIIVKQCKHKSRLNWNPHFLILMCEYFDFLNLKFSFMLFLFWTQVVVFYHINYNLLFRKARNLALSITNTWCNVVIHHRIWVYTIVNTLLSLSLLHPGYRHCRYFEIFWVKWDI